MSRIKLAVPAAVTTTQAQASATDMFREHGRYAFRLLRRLGVHEADVDDVLQEVFVVVHRKLPDFDPARSGRAWLYGICVRVAANYRRSQRKRRELPVEQESEPVNLHAATPVEILEERKMRAALDRILSELPNPKRGNGFSGDGCEVDLQTDPHHCGACGHECDLALGQPCVKGECVVTECTGEETR